jgi:hypothetical protein
MSRFMRQIIAETLLRDQSPCSVLGQRQRQRFALGDIAVFGDSVNKSVKPSCRSLIAF